MRILKKDVPAEYRALIQKFRLIDDTFFNVYTVPKDVDTEQEGMGKNRENTVQMKILSGTKKTFS